MNLQNIVSDIEQVDPEIYDRLDTRRHAMQQFARVSGKIALAAIPMALGSMFKKAYGQTNTDVIATLQFALTLEYLEAEFYTNIVAAPGLIPAGTPAVAALTKIRDHENTHVTYLKAVLNSMSVTPTAKPTFDFTAGNGTGTGPFAGYLANYDLALAMAQTFEDTGVRAYKGAAGTLINNNDVLTAALGIHSVEARHASHIRQMRRTRGTTAGALYVGTAKPWIVQNQSNIGSTAVQASYNGEELAIQAGVNIATIGGVSSDAATASFDEPLTRAAVLAIVDPFIV